MSKRTMNARRAFLQAEAVGRSATSISANQARQVLESIEWSEREWVRGEGGWFLYEDAALDFMAVWVDEDQQAIVIHPDTWETLAFDEDAISLLFTDMRGPTGMRFVVADAGPYADAARKRAEHDGVDEVGDETDQLQGIVKRAQALVEQAAALNRAPSALQAQVFAQKYATLETDFAAMQERMNEVRTLLNLAATALYDASR